jgi:hypothetical protein
MKARPEKCPGFLLLISQQVQPLHSSLIQPLPCNLKDRAVWASPALTQIARTFYRHFIFSNTVFNILLKFPQAFWLANF